MGEWERRRRVSVSFLYARLIGGVVVILPFFSYFLLNQLLSPIHTQQGEDAKDRAYRAVEELKTPKDEK